MCIRTNKIESEDFERQETPGEDETNNISDFADEMIIEDDGLTPELLQFAEYLQNMLAANSDEEQGITSSDDYDDQKIEGNNSDSSDNSVN